MSKLVGIITAAALVMVLLGTFAYGASNALADSPPDWSGRLVAQRRNQLFSRISRIVMAI